MKRHFLLLSMLSAIALIFTACSKDDSDSSYSNDSIKKDKTIPEDTSKSLLKDVQDLTDDFIKQIDEIAKNKQKEIMTI